MKKINTLLYTLLAAVMTLTATGANAQSWNFSTMSQTDQDNCNADVNWVAGTGRYGYVLALDNEALIANGTELEYTKGLLFTANAPSAPEDGKAKVRCNYEKGQLELNGTGVQMTIPGLKAGQVITVKCLTAKSGQARGLDATNLSGTTGFGQESISADAMSCTGTVSADGDVTLTTLVGGMYLYNVDVQSQGEVTPPTPDYNDVALNTAKNQMRLTLGSEIKYYNTDDVKVAFDRTAGTVTVTPNAGTWQDVYTKTVSKIDFAAAQPTGGDGDIQEGEIKITEAKGWQESLYAKWEKHSGAESYNVYVKGGQYSDWTKIDQQLVRDYGSYARADVVGLVAGSDYAIKVVAVNGEGKEVSGVEGVAENMTVVNYSREGFAHFNRSEGVGAYNNDGSLKAGAKVFYVTANTAKTITTTVNVDGKQQSCTGIQTILDAYQKGDDTTPIAFRIIGLVEADDLDHMSSGSEGIQIKGKSSYSTMNITIEGIGEDAAVRGFGFLCRNTESIEFRNFAIMRCMDDCISLDTDNSNIWIHNMDFFYGKAGSGDHAKGDGTVDLKADTKLITIDNNRFWDTGKSSLCGQGEDAGQNYITYHHNWFDHSDSRTPRVRNMSVHVWNNYYHHTDTYGVGAASESSVFVDRNYFNAVRKPMMIASQGADIKDDGKSSILSGENGGMIKSYGNVFTNKPSNFNYTTYQQNSSNFDAYEVANATYVVPTSVKAIKGGHTYTNFDTDKSLMYEYTADAAEDVPAVVTGYYGAGRLNHGDIDFIIPDEQYKGGTDREQCLPELANIIDNYKSSFTIYGDENAESGEQGSEGGDESGEQGGTEPGGDEGGEQGGDTPVIEGTVTCNFNGSVSNNAFIAEKDGSEPSFTNKGGPVVVDGVSYEKGLKVENKTTVTFTTSETMTMIVYLGSASVDNLKLDGETITVNDATANTITVTVSAGTHVISRGSGEGHIYFIKLVPVE